MEKSSSKREFNQVKNQKNYFDNLKFDKAGSREFDKEGKIKNNPFRIITKPSSELVFNPKIRFNKSVDPLLRYSY